VANVTTPVSTQPKHPLLTVTEILALALSWTGVLLRCMILISSCKVRAQPSSSSCDLFVSEQLGNVAHGGLQGTTRPTHYYVVHDEIKFKADELQGLTNSVSYMFARATKAVSLVSPAYYADLACERGRCYLHRLLQGIGGSGTTTASGDDQVKQEATKMWQGGVSAALKHTMFYL
jgi:hypothetical protein